MKYRTTNGDEANMTSLQGEVYAEYATLKKLFGNPTDGDGYKVDAEWCIVFQDGTVATIYNWKNGKNYCGASGVSKTRIREWHIGGFNKNAVARVEEVLNAVV
jgi:hypothetical protein